MRRSGSTLCWIDGITDGDDREPALLCHRGRQGAYVTELRPILSLERSSVFDVEDGRFPAAETLNMPLSIPELSRLEPLLRPHPIVRSVFPQLRLSGRHTVFMVRGATPVFLPAGLLISALFARSNLMKWLLVPNSLDILAIPGARTKDELVLEVGTALRLEQMSDAAYRTLAWLAHNDDARTAWSSVLFGALAGRIDIRLPRVRLDCWLRGTVTPWGVLASSLSGVEIGIGIASQRVRVIYGVGRMERVIPAYVPRPRSPAASNWGVT